MADTTRQTMYGIRLQCAPNVYQWAAPRNHWADTPDRALRFHSMTAATIAAIEILQLAPDTFTVEAI